MMTLTHSLSNSTNERTDRQTEHGDDHHHRSFCEVAGPLLLAFFPNIRTHLHFTTTTNIHSIPISSNARTTDENTQLNTKEKVTQAHNKHAATHRSRIFWGFGFHKRDWRVYYQRRILSNHGPRNGLLPKLGRRGHILSRQKSSSRGLPQKSIRFITQRKFDNDLGEQKFWTL